MGISSSFWPWFMSYRRWNSTVTKVALADHVGILHVHSNRSLLVLVSHTCPHVGQAHARWPHARVVVLMWSLWPWESVAHGVHGVALWMVVGRVHASFRRRSGLHGDWTRAQGGAMSRPHVGVLLLLVERLQLVGVRAHRIPWTHVRSFNHVVLEGEETCFNWYTCGASRQTLKCIFHFISKLHATLFVP